MTSWTNQQIKEAANCIRDPLYFLENFIWLDADEGIIPFVIGYEEGQDFFYQREIIKHLLNHENVAVLKSRRVGLSWIAAFYTAWLINFHRGVNVLFVSRGEKEAISLLDKVRFILNNLAYRDSNDITRATPADFLRNEIVIDQQTMLGIGHRNQKGEVASISRVRSLTTTKHSGRGEKAAFVFVDEVQFIDHQDEVFGAVLTTAARAGHWMMGSNAGDVGTRFHHLCMLGRAKENKNFWYREVWPHEAGIDKETIEAQSEVLTEDVIAQEWYLTFRQPGNAVFDITHLSACYKPLDMFPALKTELETYRDKVIDGVPGFKYYSGVDSALGKAHRKSKEKDYNAWVSLTHHGIQAFAYYDKKPISTWAGHNIVNERGDTIALPGKVSELHSEWPGLCTIEENGPGALVISRHITPNDGLSDYRSIDVKHHIKSRIIKNLIIAIESHAITVIDEKTYQQLSVFQYGEVPDTYDCPPGFNDDLVMALAEAYDGIMLEGGGELVIGGSNMDALERRPYDQRYHELINLHDAAVAPAVAYKVPAGVRINALLPRPFETEPIIPDSRFLPDPRIMESINGRLNRFKR